VYHREVMKAIMQKQNVTNKQLADRLGVSPAVMSARLDSRDKKNGEKKDSPVSIVSSTLHGMDYKLIAVPADARIPAGGYEVE